MLCWLDNATLLSNDDVLPADIKDKKGRTPVDLARERKHNEVDDYITNYKPLARGELHMIVTSYKLAVEIPPDLDISLSITAVGRPSVIVTV